MPELYACGEIPDAQFLLETYGTEDIDEAADRIMEETMTKGDCLMVIKHDELGFVAWFIFADNNYEDVEEDRLMSYGATPSKAIVALDYIYYTPMNELYDMTPEEFVEALKRIELEDKE